MRRWFSIDWIFDLFNDFLNYKLMKPDINPEAFVIEYNLKDFYVWKRVTVDHGFAIVHQEPNDVTYWSLNRKNSAISSWVKPFENAG